MKRFISLLIALVLLVSMFALPTLALAEGTETPDSPEVGEEVARDVDFSVDAFKKYIIDNNKGYFVEMNKEFKLNLTWTDKAEVEDEDDIIHELLKDADALHELFPGELHYIVLPEEGDVEDNEDNKFTLTYKAGDEGAVEDQDDVTEEVLKTKYVTLKAASTFAGKEEYEFVGWLAPVDYDGTLLEEGKFNLYRAGDKFVMPAQDIEVVAYWYLKDVDDSEDNGEAGEEQGADLEEKLDFTYPVNDIICLEYCSPSDDPKNENWTRVKADSVISLNATGFWMFRLVVVDGEKNDITDDDSVLTPYNSEEFISERLREDGVNGEEVYHWEEFTLTRYAVDTTKPEIALSSSMKTKMEDGLTVGTTYSISTSLTITDSSNTTVTYKVYRQEAAGGAGKGDGDSWKLIYDSTATTKVVEGYENYISSSGTINPQSEDVTTAGNYRYKVVYSVKDANGYFGVAESEEAENGTKDESGEFHPTLYLGVKLNEQGVKSKQRMEIWKIILFVIAGLSAVGIVVLLFIKPKQAVVGDSRVSAVDDAYGDSDGVVDDTPTDDTDGTK